MYSFAGLWPNGRIVTGDKMTVKGCAVGQSM